MCIFAQTLLLLNLIILIVDFFPASWNDKLKLPFDFIFVGTWDVTGVDFLMEICSRIYAYDHLISRSQEIMRQVLYVFAQSLLLLNFHINCGIVLVSRSGSTQM